MIQSRKRRYLLVAAIACVTAVCAVLVFVQQAVPRMPHRWTFRGGIASLDTMRGWHAYDGSWQVVDGVVTNDSEERGAKLMTGSAAWRDYAVDADVKLLGEVGDAGLVLRSTAEERGVDSYSGYYAGLRSPDGSLLLGRADHGWVEYGAVRLTSRVLPAHWYHLRVVAVGCSIAARVTDPSSGEQRSMAIHESAERCAAAGRLGLRSTSAGAAWRNIAVAPATAADLVSMRSPQQHTALIERPHNLRQLIDNFRLTVNSPVAVASSVGQTFVRQPISSLRLGSPAHPGSVLLHGEVVLLHPVLFVQDATGGVSLPGATSPPLKIGDQVEARGVVDFHTFSTSILHSQVRLLWPGTPSPPLSIEVLQAATGQYEGRFVELQARLEGSEQRGSTQVLNLADDDQRFQAWIENRGSGYPSAFKQQSLLRIRGVCTSSAKYTGGQMPFILLLHSVDDVQTITGPPLYSKRNLAIGLGALIFSSLLAYLFYIRAEQWRLRAVIDERQRLAHELHDTLAQSFAGVGFQLRAIRRKLPDDMPALHRQMDLAADLVRQGHQEARQSISTLRPSSTGRIELLPALTQAARRIISDDSIILHTDTLGNERPLPLDLVDVLFRVGQEAIANAVRHACCRSIRIALEYGERSVALSVQDDGVGIQKEMPAGSFGLSGVQARVRSVGGTFGLKNASPYGTLFTVVLPAAPPRSIRPFSKNAYLEAAACAGFG